MSRPKDEFVNRTGGFRAGESQEEFAARVREINELETNMKAGRFPLGDLERVQRRLCDLKGISFDDEDDDF